MQPKFVITFGNLLDTAVRVIEATDEQFPEGETLTIGTLPQDAGKVAIRGPGDSVVWVPETMSRVERWMVRNGTHPDYPKE